MRGLQTKMQMLENLRIKFMQPNFDIYIYVNDETLCWHTAIANGYVSLQCT